MATRVKKLGMAIATYKHGFIIRNRCASLWQKGRTPRLPNNYGGEVVLQKLVILDGNEDCVQQGQKEKHHEGGPRGLCCLYPLPAERTKDDKQPSQREHDQRPAKDTSELMDVYMFYDTLPRCILYRMSEPSTGARTANLIFSTPRTTRSFKTDTTSRLNIALR
ncbi:hypothetical protein RvY_10733 [Ramazzottius varieornatus]|uniref:Uncharacterized protein n=1 Tax=Ramazzottius varieornatus TaxID=947166 RepID=A0A1D1VDQ7_RAMVA|nr:hypothetical protein RvY_10733 [Ramazzottius varieornatus]